MSKLRDHVREKLSGLEARQASRDAARKLQATMQAAYKLRRSGDFRELEETRSILGSMGIGYTEEPLPYGFTLLHLHCAVTLAYGPNNVLDWHAQARHTRDENEQMVLFSDPVSAPVEAVA